MKYEIGKKWKESSYGREYLRGKTVVYRATRNYLRTAGNALHGQSNLMPESGGAKPPFTKSTSSWRLVGKWNLTLRTCVLGTWCQRSASYFGHFTSDENAEITDWEISWDPTGGLDALENTWISCFSRESNPDSSFFPLVAWLPYRLGFPVSFHMRIYSPQVTYHASAVKARVFVWSESK